MDCNFLNCFDKIVDLNAERVHLGCYYDALNTKNTTEPFLSNQVRFCCWSDFLPATNYEAFLWGVGEGSIFCFLSCLLIYKFFTSRIPGVFHAKTDTENFTDNGVTVSE